MNLSFWNTVSVSLQMDLLSKKNWKYIAQLDGQSLSDVLRDPTAQCILKHRRISAYYTICILFAALCSIPSEGKRRIYKSWCMGVLKLKEIGGKLLSDVVLLLLKKQKVICFDPLYKQIFLKWKTSLIKSVHENNLLKLYYTPTKKNFTILKCTR